MADSPHRGNHPLEKRHCMTLCGTQNECCAEAMEGEAKTAFPLSATIQTISLNPMRRLTAQLQRISMPAPAAPALSSAATDSGDGTL
jgi:hypothetical protein